jgi:F0F1-type ATP synthase assembly protein I
MKSKILKESMLFTVTSVAGPILTFGGIGYALDYFFGTDKVFLLSAIAVSFIVTQIVMFKKISSGYAQIASHIKKDDLEIDDDTSTIQN